MSCPACAQGFKGMKSLVLSTLFNCLDMRGSNPLWPAVGYSGARPPHPDTLNLNMPTRARFQTALAGRRPLGCAPATPSRPKPKPAWTCAASTRSGRPSATQVRARHTPTPALGGSHTR